MKLQAWKQTAVMALTGIFIVVGLAIPQTASSQDDATQLLKQRLEQMNAEMQEIQQKLDDLERKNAAKAEEIEEIDDRLNKAELHTATDKVAFGVELRTRADTLQYKDIQVAPSSFVGGFFVDYPNGLNNATLPQIHHDRRHGRRPIHVAQRDPAVGRADVRAICEIRIKAVERFICKPADLRE